MNFAGKWACQWTEGQARPLQWQSLSLVTFGPGGRDPSRAGRGATVTAAGRRGHNSLNDHGLQLHAPMLVATVFHSIISQQDSPWTRRGLDPKAPLAAQEELLDAVK